MSGPGKAALAPERDDVAKPGAFPKHAVDQIFMVVDAGNPQTGLQPRIRVRGREYHVCRRSLFIFNVNGWFRRQVIALVDWKWFDRFILFLIMVNSVLLAAYQYRAPEDDVFNRTVDSILDPVFTGFFSIEFALKVIAWGFFLDARSYLREFWNWLDFVVVVTALLSFIPGMDSGLGFLRLFRILRPLRSLNALPQMKLLVNTVISSVPRLANVTIMMFFCFWIFGIIGITLLDGIFYHGCRTTPAPVLKVTNSSTCWEWPFTGDDRLCGGRYSCDNPPEGVARGFCGGQEDDPNKSVRPIFPGGRQGYPWCAGSEPKKVFPETDFVHFDHMGGALLTVFQCMTMEGWTDIMYYVQDGYGFWVATIYFFTLIPITSFFLLNVALAVVDEAREDIDGGKAEEDEEEEEGSQKDEDDPHLIKEDALAQALRDKKSRLVPEYWLDIAPVRVLHSVAYNEIFVNFIMLFIAANVVTMMLEQFPPQVAWQDFLDICEKTFLGIFSIEMVIMLGAMGPKEYVMNPVTCFDGIIVIGSLVQVFITSGGSALTALRTLRLSRVLNKLANRWPSFRVLLKAMVQTGISLNYWLVLFFLMLYIITLMCMSFFQKTMHFDDMDSYATVSADQGQPWCAGSENETDVAFKQDCIPRAHFDTFLWALVTVFQIMTGENWNWIMYSAMRAQHWLVAILFVCIIVFGQILFLSLFLSMLMSKFDSVQDHLEKVEMSRRASLASLGSTGTQSFSVNFKAAITKMATRRLSSLNLVDPVEEEDTSCADTPRTASSKAVGGKVSESGRTGSKDLGAAFSPVLPLPGMMSPRSDNGVEASWAGQVEMPPKKGGDDTRLSQDPSMFKLDFGEEASQQQAEQPAPHRPQEQEPQQEPPPRLEQPPQQGQPPQAQLPHEQGQQEQEPPLKPQLQEQQEQQQEEQQQQEQPQERPQELQQQEGQQQVMQQQEQQFQQEQQQEQQPQERRGSSSSSSQPRPPTSKGVARGAPQDNAAPLDVPKEEEISDLCDGPLDVQLPAGTPISPQSFNLDTPASLELEPQAPKSRRRRRGWPHGYALFLLRRSNPIRRACRWVLEYSIRKVNIFDNFILLCILVSTVGMALDYPLRDPSDMVTKIIRQADFVFAIIFTAEMVIKLMAHGLFWGHGAYLHSGWNWLDGIVVCVSLLGIFTKGAGGFLKTLRILRAFRPLRVISRNENLKVVVQTIFASFPALLTLVIVCMVFLLIFALFALSSLNGTFYQCEAGSVTPKLQRHLSPSGGLPLCLDANASHIHSVCPRGQWSDSTRTWQDSGSCIPGNVHCTHGAPSDFTMAYQRATADTPICVGRCSLGGDSTAPAWLCPRRFATAEELPSNCASGTTRSVSPQFLQQEAIGQAYVDSMTRKLAMPCGGSVPGASGLEFPASAVSCSAVFCPNGASEERKASCEGNCKKHPHFCKDACKSGSESTVTCASCRKECQAACECEEHCEPLTKDAALCVEQGGSWMPSVQQNFNNIWNSLLTLFEISSTEAWVDVMYAACDSTAPYEQPVRDNQQWMFAPFFMVYIFMSFMFLLNLSVGVIVDNFMDLKQELGKTGGSALLTPAQERWIKSSLRLFQRPVLFTLTNLHKLGSWRRSVYTVISSESFEATMTSIIVGNTVVMASKLYPAPTEWWEDMREGLDYVFTGIFTVEFVLKFYALRRRYWSVSWNCFDFLCVATAIVGIVLNFAAPDMVIATTLTQLLRIFRIARLFRLLKSKRLNTIFMALVLSLPKLANVLMVLLLLLILYSILGVSLFSSVKHSEYLNNHGNFAHIGWAFITLFRGVTGEAWNSIMHDLLKGEKDFFEEGSWCAPDSLYDTSTPEKFRVLNDKCLIENPNSCVQTIGGWNLFPAAFWTTYILIIVLVVMNLVIAVILEGYNDGKGAPEDEIIEKCISTWRRYDSDQKMTLPLKEAMHFIYEVTSQWMKQQHQKQAKASTGNASDTITLMSDLSKIPMKSANALKLSLADDGRVDFIEATKQVLRFTAIDNDLSRLNEVMEDEIHPLIDKKEANRLKKLEIKTTKHLQVDRTMSSDLRLAVAAVKLQRYYRTHVVPNRARNWVIEEVR